MRKLKGGYDVLLTGRPAAKIEDLPLPSRLLLPLRNGRLNFSDVLVVDGQTVQPGMLVARDPSSRNFLPAPAAGVVRLGAVADHVVLEALQPGGQPAELELPPDLDGRAQKRYRLLARGAWAEVSDALTGSPADPYEEPAAVIVSTLRLEPFLTRGDVLIRRDKEAFFRGLELLQTLLEYQQVHLVLPDIRAPLAAEIRQRLRGLAHIHLMDVPLRYPLDNFNLLARKLGYRPSGGQNIWAMHVEGVLAIERALGRELPCTHRVVTLAGPAVETSTHYRLPLGYPIADLLAGRVKDVPAMRVIDGGVLAGQTLSAESASLGILCAGLTVLAEPAEPEFWGWMRPGWSRRSYHRCFLSSLRPAFAAPLTTAMRGERRACVACMACEKVCPARIRPHLIHKALYADQLEEADALGADLCIGCGLCSYVCPSKIELRGQMLDAQARIAEELRGEEVQA